MAYRLFTPIFRVCFIWLLTLGPSINETGRLEPSQSQVAMGMQLPRLHQPGYQNKCFFLAFALVGPPLGYFIAGLLVGPVSRHVHEDDGERPKFVERNEWPELIHSQLQYFDNGLPILNNAEGEELFHQPNNDFYCVEELPEQLLHLGMLPPDVEDQQQQLAELHDQQNLMVGLLLGFAYLLPQITQGFFYVCGDVFSLRLVQEIILLQVAQVIRREHVEASQAVEQVFHSDEAAHEGIGGVVANRKRSNTVGEAFPLAVAGFEPETSQCFNLGEVQVVVTAETVDERGKPAEYTEGAVREQLLVPDLHHELEQGVQVAALPVDLPVNLLQAQQRAPLVGDRQDRLEVSVHFLLFYAGTCHHNIYFPSWNSLGQSNRYGHGSIEKINQWQQLSVLLVLFIFLRFSGLPSRKQKLQLQASSIQKSQIFILLLASQISEILAVALLSMEAMAFITSLGMSSWMDFSRPLPKARLPLFCTSEQNRSRFSISSKYSWSKFSRMNLLCSCFRL